MLDDLVERYRRHDRLALSRLISLVARGEHVSQILGQLPRPPRPAKVVAVTGSGGVGKSTFVGKLIGHVRGKGETIAVLACDPESPVSGGALLGDRFRMPARPDDDGVFIRSLAAVSGHGAIADHLDALVRLLEGFGFETVVIETVGAGQGDTAVRSLADVVVLLLQPETGDDLQWEKAGVLEVADIIVIHKADLPGAEQVEAQVRAAIGLTGGPGIPVLRVSARTGEGLSKLWDEIVSVAGRKRTPNRDGADLLRLAQRLLGDRYVRATHSPGDPAQQILAEWRQGAVPADLAAARLLQHLAGN